MSLASGREIPADTFSPENSPYPGLRPFQADDSDYFYGRETQIEDVISRLRKSRFVAVIGGSGSGKSSLVLAGAIPRLRTFAIKDAGDFWIPVVCTPGTNHVEDSPLGRLASAFCSLIEVGTNGAETAKEALELLRQQNGLGHLVARFGRNLKHPDGVDLSRPEVQVNFLFLIDQFEEIFHPSNVAASVAADCRHIVNRIVEQFRSPHPQVCVSLTMRSEHLNDCTRYEDLPDAINGSAYLVKRLDGEQLVQAIKEPALRYLRLQVAHERRLRREAQQKGEEVLAGAKWPDEIEFEEGLVARLLDDSSALLAQQDHTDHLPLLQHLLFWLWAAARQRDPTLTVPRTLTLADLRVAVAPTLGRDDFTLTHSLNTLESCLENKCESIFLENPGQQARWRAVFERLAFKDPNTGTYTQQRVATETLFELMGDGERDQVHLGNVFSGWLLPHRYIQWDVDTSTIKVAHETLIRRWDRFRKWIDSEDSQYQVYLRLLDDCSTWELSQRQDSFLITGEMLRRYNDSALFEALQSENRVARFSQLLAMDRDGHRLSKFSSSALIFLSTSRAHQEKIERELEKSKEERRANQERIAQAARDAVVERKRTLTFVIVCIGLGFLAFGLFTKSMLFRKEDTLALGYRASVETQFVFTPSFLGLRDLTIPQLPLRSLLMGSHFVEEGAQESNGPAEWPVVQIGFKRRLAEIEKLELSAEEHSIAGLKAVMLASPWSNVKPIAPLLQSVDIADCKDVKSAFPIPALAASQTKFYSRGKPGDGSNGLVISHAPKEGITNLYLGKLKDDGKCEIVQPLISPPVDPGVRVGIVGDLDSVVFEFPAYLQFYTIFWNSGAIKFNFGVQKIRDNEWYLPSQSDVALLASSRADFATDVHFDNLVVRLFDHEPMLLTPAEGNAGSALVSDTSKGGPCTSVLSYHGAVLEQEDSVQPEVWAINVPKDRHIYCLHVFFNKDNKSPAYLASLYRIDPTLPVDPQAEATPLLDQLNLGPNHPSGFREYRRSGWLSYQDGSGNWRGFPWSHDAWRALAKSVFQVDETKKIEKGQLYKLAFDSVFANTDIPTDDDLRIELQNLP